jgi:hypothetical protein
LDLLNVWIWVAVEEESARLIKELNQEKGGDREEGVIKKR